VTPARVLFLIPARGGSKGLPGKNLRRLGGIPLVGWASRACASASRRLEGGAHRVVCSTDSSEIAEAASQWGAEIPFLRPGELATDSAESADVARHALSWFRDRGETFSTVALVQPTTPLVTADDVLAAVRQSARERAPVVSVAASPHAAWAMIMEEAGGLRFALDAAAPRRRQDAPRLVEPNGAVYASPVDWILAGKRFLENGTLGLEMPASRSLDVDALDDLHRCEGILAGRPIESVRVGRRWIGPGQPCFVIAEAGVNHDGDTKKAHRLIDAGADAGADAIKFQTFDPEALASADAPLAEYQQATETTSTQREMLDRLVLPRAAYAELKGHAEQRGLVFFSSPFDEGSADFLAELGVPALKIASGELINHGFLSHVARQGLPLIVSTGMATLAEVASAVDCVDGAVPLILLHCVSNYPAAAQDANLRAMDTLRRAFGVPVGWSDHMPGIDVAIAAAALGANVIEKHLTLDRTSNGPDHASSTEPADFRRMVDGVRGAERALGDGRKAPAAAEAPIARIARKSLHWRESLPAGTIVEPGHLIALRPGTGLSPALAPRTVGRRTRRNVSGGTALQESDLES